MKTKCVEETFHQVHTEKDTESNQNKEVESDECLCMRDKDHVEKFFQNYCQETASFDSASDSVIEEDLSQLGVCKRQCPKTQV